jgi:hypothetical protein
MHIPLQVFQQNIIENVFVRRVRAPASHILWLAKRISIEDRFCFCCGTDAHHSVDSSPAVGERPRVIERLFAALLFGEGAEAAAGDEGFDEAVEDVGGGEEGDGLEG